MHDSIFLSTAGRTSRTNFGPPKSNLVQTRFQVLEEQVMKSETQVNVEELIEQRCQEVEGGKSHLQVLNWTTKKLRSERQRRVQGCREVEEKKNKVKQVVRVERQGTGRD